MRTAGERAPGATYPLVTEDTKFWDESKDYTGGDNFEECVKDAIDFITEMFLSKVEDKERRVHVHVISSVDKENVAEAMWDVGNVLFKRGL